MRAFPCGRRPKGPAPSGSRRQRPQESAVERKVERFGWTFAPGDKIMQIENDYDKDVYNGDNGR